MVINNRSINQYQPTFTGIKGMYSVTRRIADDAGEVLGHKARQFADAMQLSLDTRLYVDEGLDTFKKTEGNDFLVSPKHMAKIRRNREEITKESKNAGVDVTITAEQGVQGVSPNIYMNIVGVNTTKKVDLVPHQVQAVIDDIEKPKPEFPLVGIVKGAIHNYRREQEAAAKATQQNDFNIFRFISSMFGVNN